MVDTVEPCAAWTLFLKYRNAPGGFIWRYTYPTRHDVIAAYDRCYTRPGQYARDRRRGLVKAVRVTIQIAVEQDQ